MRARLLGVASPVALLMAMSASAALAQTPASDSKAGAPPAATVEEVVVTGLRESLRTSEHIKREASGVVDAITAEDIGKFPDTNLAESIQRIPGVTISRNNNEGSRITVRGFGEEFNLVTLNGRSMPGTVTSRQANATRSFDFANLSADSVSGITVYKTGRPDVPSGGIGATVDITTARPFDFNGQRASFQVRATDDLSTKVGRKITPEVSGLYSNTFFDGMVGILLNGSYSERNNREEVAGVGGWLRDQIPPGVNTPGVTYQGGTPTAHNWEPQSENWGVNDYHRTRKNAQAVLQFRPIQSLVATADYTYFLFDDRIDRQSFGAWFDYGGSLYGATVNKNGTVVKLQDFGSDLSYSDFFNHDRNEGKSLGFNVKWDVLENLTVNFDAHHSTADSGGAPEGNNVFFITGQQPPIAGGGQGALTKDFTVGNTLIPTTLFSYSPPYNVGNLTTSTIEPLFGIAANNAFKTRINEARLDAVWRNDSDSGLKSLKAGVQYKDMLTQTYTYSAFYPAGFYNPADRGILPDNLFHKISTCSILKQFSGGGCGNLTPYFYTFNAFAAAQAVKSKYNFDLVVPSTPNNQDNIDEKTWAGYVQGELDTDFNGMRFRALGGVRYEHTDVVARSLQQLPTAVSWDNPTEFHTLYAANTSYTHVSSSYDEFLPSLDTSLELRKNLILRASYSKTIARSDLNAMVGTFSVSGTPKPGSRTASQGNPGLLPYESQNIDVAAEWYYGPDSYLAVTYFDKHVTNFLTSTTVNGPIGGLTDPSAGPRAQKAAAEVAAAGLPATPQNIFAQLLKDYPGQTSFVGQAEDPLISWLITTPSNANAVELHGIEISLQHMFGDTGFGLQANISLPSGGAKFNPGVVDTQFVLPGLSKSYNIVGFYEKYGFQGRLAYTHRDKYLAGLGQAQGAAGEPTFVSAYGQLDGSASYEINPHTVVFVDGINMLRAKQTTYGRFNEQFLSASAGFARYQVGFRFKF